MRARLFQPALPVRDRAPTWELAVRRYGRHKPLPQAAGEIGLDEIRGRLLLEQFSAELTRVPPPELEHSERTVVPEALEQRPRPAP